MKFGTFPYLRKPNSELRSREYLTEDEVKRLIKAVTNTTHALRNKTLIEVHFRHALRPNEVLNLRWDQFLFDTLPKPTLHIKSLKNSLPGVHPIYDQEIRYLKRLLKENKNNSPWVFQSQKGGAMGIVAYQKMLKIAGREAGIPFQVHPHMLRHAPLTQLSNQGVDAQTLQLFARHKNIQNTMRYIVASSKPFESFYGN